MADPQPVVYKIICLLQDENAPFKIEIEGSKIVDDLKKKIKAENNNALADIDPRLLQLFTVDIPDDDDLERNVNQKLNANPKPLRATHPIKGLYPDSPPEETVHILVKVPKTSSKRKLPEPGTSSSDDTEPAFKRLHIEREEAFKIARSKPTPSSAATSEGLLLAQAKNPILNGRPFEAVGPPITIYEPVFSSFCAMNEGKKTVNPSQEDYKHVKDFLVSSSKLYKTEKERQMAITVPLEKLLQKLFITLTLDDNTSNDGLIQETFGEIPCLLLVREIKNDGGRGDASIQVGYSYTRWWASNLGRHFRDRTCCPSFLLSIDGPSIYVQGGILAGKYWTVQPLADSSWASRPADLDGHTKKIGRLLCSLKIALDELKGRFEAVKDIPPPSPPPYFPSITSYFDEITQCQETINYEERLHFQEGRGATAIFSATLQKNHAVFLKFVTRYNDEAHRLLAKKGYAPRLRYRSKLENGGTHFMVVMDRIDGHDMHGQPFNEEDLTRIRAAKDLLHENGYVFGDLRPNNILKPTDGTGVVLVDFDWCGEEDVDRYPLFINNDVTCNWHSEVEGNGIMRKIHDDHLFDSLGRS